MKQVEEAYESLVKYSIAFAEGRLWSLISVKFNIYYKMASANQFLVYKGVKTEVGGF